MLIIQPHTKDNPKDDHYIDRLLKKFKYKIKETKLIENLRKRQVYVKPSVKKRELRIKAINVRKYKEKHEE